MGLIGSPLGNALSAAAKVGAQTYLEDMQQKRQENLYRFQDQLATEREGRAEERALAKEGRDNQALLEREKRNEESMIAREGRQSAQGRSDKLWELEQTKGALPVAINGDGMILNALETEKAKAKGEKLTYVNLEKLKDQELARRLTEAQIIKTTKPDVYDEIRAETARERIEASREKTKQEALAKNITSATRILKEASSLPEGSADQSNSYAAYNALAKKSGLPQAVQVEESLPGKEHWYGNEPDKKMKVWKMGEVLSDDTSGETDAKAPKTVRLNNPGALMGKDGQMRVFATKQEGEEALRADLVAKFTGKSAHIQLPITPAKLAEVWSPADAKGNSKEKTDNYAKDLAAQYGVGVNDVVSYSPEVINKTMGVVANREAGQPWRWSANEKPISKYWKN